MKSIDFLEEFLRRSQPDMDRYLTEDYNVVGLTNSDLYQIIRKEVVNHYESYQMGRSGVLNVKRTEISDVVSNQSTDSTIKTSTNETDSFETPTTADDPARNEQAPNSIQCPCPLHSQPNVTEPAATDNVSENQPVSSTTSDVNAVSTSQPRGRPRKRINKSGNGNISKKQKTDGSLSDGPKPDIPKRVQPPRRASHKLDHKCDFCEFSALDQNALDIHMCEKHEEFECAYSKACGKKFSGKMGFIDHMRSHLPRTDDPAFATHESSYTDDQLVQKYRKVA